MFTVIPNLKNCSLTWSGLSLGPSTSGHSSCHVTSRDSIPKGRSSSVFLCQSFCRHKDLLRAMVIPRNYCLTFTVGNKAKSAKAKNERQEKQRNKIACTRQQQHRDHFHHGDHLHHLHLYVSHIFLTQRTPLNTRLKES